MKRGRCVWCLREGIPIVYSRGRDRWAEHVTPGPDVIERCLASGHVTTLPLRTRYLRAARWRARMRTLRNIHPAWLLLPVVLLCVGSTARFLSRWM